MNHSRLFRCVIAAATLAASSVAFAYPQLLSSTPADKAEIASPSRIGLQFSEALVPESSAASLLMTGMPGMPGHGPMKMALVVSAGSDGKSMVITPMRPLPKGSYRLDWRAVSADARPTTGTITFEVK